MVSTDYARLCAKTGVLLATIFVLLLSPRCPYHVPSPIM